MPNARKNLGSGAKPPEGIHIIKNEFDFNLLIFKKPLILSNL
jgi:hypothetical protein